MSALICLNFNIYGVYCLFESYRPYLLLFYNLFALIELKINMTTFKNCKLDTFNLS